MMEFFQQLPHLEPYGNPQYFVYVILCNLAHLYQYLFQETLCLV